MNTTQLNKLVLISLKTSVASFTRLLNLNFSWIYGLLYAKDFFSRYNEIFF